MLGKYGRKCFMDALEQVMKKEMKKAVIGMAFYEKQLQKLPRGTLRMKTIHGRQYGYLARREGYKVKYDYVGKVTDNIRARYGGTRRLRSEYREKIVSLNARLRVISRFLAAQKTLAAKSRVKTFDEVKGILEGHMGAIKEKYGVKKLGVFGSYARGKQRKDSDVDILVEYREGVKTGFDFFDLQDELRRLLKVKKVDLATREDLMPEMGKKILAEVKYI
jgi:predicted nucleotidyltransferase